MQQQGKLFLCATPIGNLADVTLRLIEVLKNTDIIAAEDTLHSKKLLSYLGLQKKLLSYHEHNKEKRGPEIIRILLAGQDVALLSDAGYPGIADPGEQLVALAVAEGIEIVPLPGANAALTAIVASGLATTPFFFGGFLPKTQKNRREKLRMWQQIPATIILYEAPHRIKQVLAEIQTAWGNRQIVLARELTKVYEEFFRGTISESRAWLEEKPPRGEFTIVIGQAAFEQVQEQGKMPAMAKLKELLAQGRDKKGSLKVVSVEYGIMKRELYQALLNEEKVKLPEES